jgi:uncharacterized protein YlxW (UPF0749 family)
LCCLHLSLQDNKHSADRLTQSFSRISTKEKLNQSGQKKERKLLSDRRNSQNRLAQFEAIGNRPPAVSDGTGTFQRFILLDFLW